MRWLRRDGANGIMAGGGNPAVGKAETAMTVTDLCLILGVIIAFATLIVKIVDSRHR